MTTYVNNYYDLERFVKSGYRKLLSNVEYYQNLSTEAFHRVFDARNRVTHKKREREDNDDRKKIEGEVGKEGCNLVCPNCL